MNSMEIVAATYLDEEHGYVDLDHQAPRFLYWRVSLDDVVTNPLRVNELSPEERRKLLLHLPAVQTALAAALVMAPIETGSPKSQPDELLTAEETARILNVNPNWLYSHSKTLPFTRKLSHKRLRFSRLGLERWMAVKR